MIQDGYTELPPGKIASVVTYLQMLKPPDAPPAPENPAFQLRHHAKPDLNGYRQLFRDVGQNWFWFSRLQMDDDTLRAIIHSPHVDVFALEVDGRAKGILELDRRGMPDIEIAFFGVTEDLVGHGAGHYLMDRALTAAWSHRPKRVWVHTCSLDHPRALGFYRKAGFAAYKRAIEVADDPRLNGTMTRTVAPHVPLV